MVELSRLPPVGSANDIETGDFELADDPTIRRSHYERLPDAQPWVIRIGYRAVRRFGGRDNWYTRSKARLGWALNVAMPGTPMLFMRSECHHWGYWWPNPDGNLATSEHRFDWAIAGDPSGISMRNLVKDINLSIIGADRNRIVPHYAIEKPNPVT